MLKCETCECEITGQFYYRGKSLLDGILCLACAVPVGSGDTNA